MPLIDNHTLDKFPARKRPILDDTPHLVFARAQLLPAEDRRLLEYAFRYRLPHRKIAQILKLPAGTVTRRIHRIVARLRDPIVASLIDARCPLVPEYRQLGVEHFLLGMTSSKLADRHRITVNEVRGMLMFIRGWHRGFLSRARISADELA